MTDWLTWPADLLLRIAGIITGWFVSSDEPSFGGIQTMVAILLLGPLIASIVEGQVVARFARLALQARHPSRAHRKMSGRAP